MEIWKIKVKLNFDRFTREEEPIKFYYRHWKIMSVFPDIFGNKHNQLKVFEEISIPYLKDLYNFARKLTKSKSDAEDLTQETYLRAFEKLDQFKPGTNCKSWLFTIMYHLFMDFHKKAENHYTFVEMEETRYIYQDSTHPAEPPIYLDEKDGDLYNLAQISQEDIEKALDQLPEKYKTLIILRDFRGFSYREVAEISKLPMGTVMSRLFRGRKLLRRFILKNLRNHEGKTIS